MLKTYLYNLVGKAVAIPSANRRPFDEVFTTGRKIASSILAKLELDDEEYSSLFLSSVHLNFNYEVAKVNRQKAVAESKLQMFCQKEIAQKIRTILVEVGIEPLVDEVISSCGKTEFVLRTEDVIEYLSG